MKNSTSYLIEIIAENSFTNLEFLNSKKWSQKNYVIDTRKVTL